MELREQNLPWPRGGRARECTASEDRLFSKARPIGFAEPEVGRREPVRCQVPPRRVCFENRSAALSAEIQITASMFVILARRAMAMPVGVPGLFFKACRGMKSLHLIKC